MKSIVPAGTLATLIAAVAGLPPAMVLASPPRESDLRTNANAWKNAIPVAGVGPTPVAAGR